MKKKARKAKNPAAVENEPEIAPFHIDTSVGSGRTRCGLAVSADVLHGPEDLVLELWDCLGFEDLCRECERLSPAVGSRRKMEAAKGGEQEEH